MIFPDATTAFLAGMGLSTGTPCALHVGGFRRFGTVIAPEWRGPEVRLTPVRAYRDHRRAELYARDQVDPHRDATGRVFIRPMACQAGRPVFVVMRERWQA